MVGPVWELEITPVLRSRLSNANNLRNDPFNIRDEMLRLAEGAGYEVDGKFVCLLFSSAGDLDIGGDALGIDNLFDGPLGTSWLYNNTPFYPPGAAHETFHIFGVGHAELLDGDTNVFPGQIIPNGLDSYVFIENERIQQTYRIFQHDGEFQVTDEMVGIRLTGYGNQDFLISYMSDAQSRAITKSGVLAHMLLDNAP